MQNLKNERIRNTIGAEFTTSKTQFLKYILLESVLTNIRKPISREILTLNFGNLCKIVT